MCVMNRILDCWEREDLLTGFPRVAGAAVGFAGDLSRVQTIPKQTHGALITAQGIRCKSHEVVLS